MSACPFCRIVAGELPATVVDEGPDWIAIRDLDPKAPTHVLVIPREHIATTNDLAPEHEALVGRIVRGAARVAAAEGLADAGYRLVWNCNTGGGQAVFHLHLHLLGGRPLSWPPG